MHDDRNPEPLREPGLGKAEQRIRVDDVRPDTDKGRADGAEVPRSAAKPGPHTRLLAPATCAEGDWSRVRTHPGKPLTRDRSERPLARDPAADRPTELSQRRDCVQDRLSCAQKLG